MKKDFYPDRVTRSYYDGMKGPSINYVPVKHRFDPGAFYMFDRVALLPEPAVVKARATMGMGVGDCCSLKQEMAQFLMQEAKQESSLLKTMGEGSRDPSRRAPTDAQSRITLTPTPDLQASHREGDIKSESDPCGVAVQEEEAHPAGGAGGPSAPPNRDAAPYRAQRSDVRDTKKPRDDAAVVREDPEDAGRDREADGPNPTRASDCRDR